MKITFGGHEFFLHQSGALYWPEEKLLIASDLHLEKGSHFALRGFFLPPYDSRETLLILQKACVETECKRLMLLGDAFHDEKGYARMGREERAMFDTLQSFAPIWIRGNHDGRFVPPGFEPMDEHGHRGVVFRHQATDAGGFEISGHYHPKTEILVRGGRLSRPCYVEDSRRMILPAIGSYAGGMFAFNPPVSDLFGEDVRYYILGKNRVYKVDPEMMDNLS